MEFPITILTKRFIFFITFFILTFIFFIFFHSKLNDKIDYSTKISNTSKLSSLSFSNNIYESRIKEQNDFSNKIFPMNLQINYLDFVYEK